MGRMTGDVITGCGCWTNAAIILKNAASLAASYWLSSIKKSNISLEEVSEASVLSVFIVFFISVKRLSVCPLDFFLLAGVGTFFLFAFDSPSEDLRKNLDLPLLHKHHHHDFLSWLSWFNSLLVLTNVHRIYRQQFTKPTSYLLILLNQMVFLPLSLHLCRYWCNV